MSDLILAAEPSVVVHRNRDACVIRYPDAHTDTTDLRDFEEIMQNHGPGKWRAHMFLRILERERKRQSSCVSGRVLDIGCGSGFDDSYELQQRLSRSASCYVGVEPDVSVAAPPCVMEFYRSTLENAPIASASIDLAFSVMVMEHLETPNRFFEAVYRVLRPGGVYWGFTMDARHWFARVSTFMEQWRVKDAYLGWLHGVRTVDRYANYPTRYLANEPFSLRRAAPRFTRMDLWSVGWVGQLNHYIPRPFRWVSNSMDRASVGAARCGTLLIVRAVK